MVQFSLEDSIMPEDEIVTPEPVVTKKRKPRSDQDSQIKNDLTAWKNVLDTLHADTAAMTALTTRGQGEAKFSLLYALQGTAQMDYNARQDRLDSISGGQRVFVEARMAATVRFGDYRNTVQVLYMDSKTRTALGASGRMPMDIDKLVTQARAAYATAKNAPYITILSANGYDEAKLTESEALLTTLTTARTSLNGLTAAAQGATQKRDDSYKALRTELRTFLGIARLALKDRSELAVTLTL
jgi:hypothetical protein